MKISELTGLPLKSVDLSKYTGWGNLEGEDCRYSYSPKHGLLADMLLDACGQDNNYGNKIVLIDEVDKVLRLDRHDSLPHEATSILRFLLDFLDQSTGEMYMRRYNNAYHNISQLKIILIANKSFREALGKEYAPALEDRVKVLSFQDGYKATEKLSIVQDHVQQMVAEEEIDRSSIDHDVIEAIIGQDEAVGHKGVRVCLSMAEKYVRFLKNLNRVQGLLGKKPKFDVEKAYECYKKQKEERDKEEKEKREKQEREDKEREEREEKDKDTEMEKQGKEKKDTGKEDNNEGEEAKEREEITNGEKRAMNEKEEAKDEDGQLNRGD